MRCHLWIFHLSGSRNATFNPGKTCFSWLRIAIDMCIEFHCIAVKYFEWQIFFYGFQVRFMKKILFFSIENGIENMKKLKLLKSEYCWMFQTCIILLNIYMNNIIECITWDVWMRNSVFLWNPFLCIDKFVKWFRQRPQTTLYIILK